MNDAARLDPLDAPLDGITLIEANAGTGKTWTITALYLRLLLEANRTVDSILVVTFTEVATAELRDRIRTRLAVARAAFERGSVDKDDPLIKGLLARIPDHARAVLQIASALRDFDQAPIYTIHAFCQRVLGDRAFESGMPFDTEILPDESLLLQEITDDFWRKTLYTASPLFVRCVLDRNVTPERLRAELSGRIGKPYLVIRKPSVHDDLAALEQSYEHGRAKARAIWRAARAAIEKQLIGNPGLSGSRYRAPWVRNWLEAMACCLESDRPGLSLFDQFEKFTPRALTDGTKKGATPPDHPFYDACGELKAAHAALAAAYERRLLLLRADLLEYCNGELAARKQRLRLQSYDDLLLNLERALRGESGERFAAAIRERYKAALIDEFQDTDPVQYRIFQTAYRGTAHAVFLVGDPKQAIYSFRGADVFAYLSARRDAQHRHALDVNWRSESGLLAAVNALFDHKTAPFVFADIPFVPSRPAPGSRGRFAIEEESAAPFELWVVSGENGKPLNKDVASELAAQATAAEIARLLELGAQSKARIGVPENGVIRERALTGGDVAVLVRTHRQANAVRAALRRLGIASVERGGDSVFASHEAQELQRLLMAIAEPGRERLIRAALVTEMIGYSGTTLHALTADEARWEETVEGFRAAHNEWHERGFIRMARLVFQHFGVMDRLLACADGERRITNLLHLVELMHREAGAQGIGAALEWLAAKRNAPERKNEDELLRLESDENLVKILTVHAAKGLEFPLVFCPFMWDGRLRASSEPAIAFHDPDNAHAAVLDLGSDSLEDCRKVAEREELAESLRLLYVALTRARYRCWMVWGNINEAETSAPAWLFHHRDDSSGSIAVSLDDALIQNDLERIEARAEGTIRVRPIPLRDHVGLARTAAPTPRLTLRTFAGSVRDTWRVTSFSGLAHAWGVETPDYDAAAHQVETESAGGTQDIFAFPRGARAGRCLHAIFEQVDFTALPRAILERLVARELAAHDFAARWVPVVADMVQAVVATPLDASGHLRLDRVPAHRRFDELEFYYPIARLSDAKLRAILLEGGFPDEIRERIGTFTFAPAQGFMKGFIDLVFEADGCFYLADYKSNWLGPSPDDYRQGNLNRAMAREAYYLQYLIYCVALHRYLALRVPGYDYETHFGGVRYLFLRGMRPETGLACGIYADRPARGLIDALDGYLKNG
ncbi:MAG TPA: exodeoxyribonuclease V subunit beta [Burkholderiales bacterium]|nr:exodeoxyribonuclease V subunit beta [Burkholderiales bacterium]